MFIFATGSPTHSLKQVLTKMKKDCWPYIQLDNLLSVKASASITAMDFDPAGFRHTIMFKIEITNVTGETVNVFDSAVHLTSSGGSVLMSSPLYGSHSPMEGRTNFIPTGQTESGSREYYWSSGPFNIVINIWASAGPKLQHIVRRVPILRDNYAAPSVIQVPVPVYIGLWESPVEVFQVWRAGQQVTWLMLAGQVVNFYHGNITVDYWHLTIESDGGVLLDHELSPAFYEVQTGKNIVANANGKLELKTQASSGFVLGTELANLPNDLSKTTLKLVLRYTRIIGSGPQKARAMCVARLKRMTPTVLLPPLKSPSSGNWQWGNAPDHTTPDSHANPGERYCYDILVVDANGKTFTGSCITNQDGITHSGACTNNSSFFAYGRPVYASASGTVKISTDTFDENFGYDKNADSNGNYRGANLVSLEHDDGTVSGYYHLRKGMNQVKPKDKVSAGTLLGYVGNSGPSSEPHLHFGYLVLHSTGRAVVSPVAFSSLKTVSGNSVTVVPGFGQYKS
jgi:hypothetical protein